MREEMGKYAVLVGINYVKNPEAALKGCCNDVRIMKRIARKLYWEARKCNGLIVLSCSVERVQGGEYQATNR